MSFLEKIELLMKENNIKNLNQLAEKTGVPYTTIRSFYEHGGENIKLSTLKKLSDFFKCSLDYLVNEYSTEEKGNNCPDRIIPDSELTRRLQQLNENEGIRILFNKVGELTEKELQQVLDIVEIIKRERNN